MKTELCEHGLPLFQSCDKCGRNMMKEADKAFKEAMMKGLKKMKLLVQLPEKK